MKFGIIFFVFVSLGVFFLNNNVYAENIKIAVLDVNKVLSEAPQVPAMQDKISNQFSPREEKIASLEENIKNNLKKINTDNKLNTKERKKLHKKIVEDQKKHSKLEKSLHTDLSLVQKDSLETINKQIEEVVSDFAKDKKITLVMSKVSTLYANPEFDISDKILLLMKE